MKLDPGIHIAMHSVLSLKAGVAGSDAPLLTLSLQLNLNAKQPLSQKLKWQVLMEEMCTVKQLILHLGTRVSDKRRIQKKLLSEPMWFVSVDRIQVRQLANYQYYFYYLLKQCAYSEFIPLQIPLIGFYTPRLDRQFYLKAN